MAHLIQHLTSISSDLRSGPSPGRRFVALMLCSMLVLASVFPGVALAGEADSEGAGTVPEVEVPVPPDLDPGGEESDLEEVPASAGGEEGGAVETESEVDTAALSPEEEVTSVATEAPIEAAPPPPASVPEPATSAPEPVQQQASEPATSEPVANQSIVGPKQKPIERHAASQSAASSEAPLPVEPTEREAPPAPQPVASTPADFAGKDSYVVRPGDCLSHIAQALLPAGADDTAIAAEVARLWHLNDDRIGTGDPDLIYPGTVLRLR